MLVPYAKHHAPQLISAGLLLIMAINLLTVAWRKSITIDETLIIPAGYYYLTTGSFQFAHEHPPLAALCAAVPLLFLPVQRPSISDLDNQPSQQQTTTVGERFWSVNNEHFKAIFFWSRVPMIVVTLLLGILIFAFTKCLFNARAGVLAVALFSLEPTILAHGRVIKDIDVAFAYLFFFFALYLYGSAATLRRALLLGLACGLALSVKYSMLIVFPILLISGCVLMFQRPGGVRRRQILIEIMTATVVSVLALNGTYLFRHQPLSIPDLRSLVLSAPAYSNTLLSLVKVGSVFVPPYFLLGAIDTFLHNDIGHPAFLLGEYRDHGWWYYFPVAFALKTSIPFLFVTISSVVWAVWRISRRDLKPLVVLIPLLIYLIFAMLAAINIGIRHFLPIFPFCFILGGALLEWLLNVKKWRPLGLASVVIVLTLCSVEAVRAYPNYISYMQDHKNS